MRSRSTVASRKVSWTLFGKGLVFTLKELAAMLQIEFTVFERGAFMVNRAAGSPAKSAEHRSSGAIEQYVNEIQLYKLMFLKGGEEPKMCAHLYGCRFASPMQVAAGTCLNYIDIELLDYH